MMRDRIVQLVALMVLVLSLAVSGGILPSILRQADDHVLRYTNVSVEGAPPFVVLGTAIGALRGLIVDYLWIKANAMKEKGLYYEAMADSELITKLQPRFAQVWSFLGHNMAYNISVATHTQQERWEWVNAGIRLVRDQGLRYNPNDLALHRELAFWFAHKIEGVSDDAHLYYKQQLCQEWHLLLGPPPDDYPERIAWIKEIADAPETLEAAEQRTPGVKQLVEKLRELYPKDQPQYRFKLDKQFLTEYSLFRAVKEQSAAAKIFGVEQRMRLTSPYFEGLDKLAGDPARQPAWQTLVHHVRKRVLKDQYNMDPQLMYEFTRDLGPIDWRHGQAHALYWSRRGAQFGGGRLSDNDIYIALNNDSQQLQAMQDLARSGRISYDLFSREAPGRFPDPRWVDVIDKLFDHYYAKWYNMRGQGGDRFIYFLQNFMGSAICELYHEGETAKAQKFRDRLNALFGGSPGSLFYNPKWTKDLDVFVRDETFDQYQAQPHLAPRDVSASLRYGYKVGILSGRPEVLVDALVFAGTVTHWYKTNDWNDYTNKFGVGRMADIIGDLEDSAEIAYLQMITDPSIKMLDRIAIWAQTDAVENEVIRRQPLLLKRQAPLLRALTYDTAKPAIQQQFQANELSRNRSFDEVFPAPPGLDQAHDRLLKRRDERQKQREEAKQRDPISRKS